MAKDIVSARSRNRMREISSNVELDELSACWEAEGFRQVPVLAPRSGGARKARFDSYVDGIDWTDTDQAQRALSAFEGMLVSFFGAVGVKPGTERYYDDIAREFTRDGFQISPTFQILPIGEWRPEHSRHAAKAYDEALRILRNARNETQRCHLLTAGMEEERLRDIQLIALNGYFEGKTTGETLNGEGKTDILIRINNLNIVICECKIWRGPKSVTDALDQLLRYTDTATVRTALLIFFRTGDPQARIADAIATIQDHPGYESTDTTRADDDQQWSFVIRGSGAPGKVTRTEVAFIPYVIA
ncbi:hypothetical protein LXH09_35455 [Streptomyces sp. CS7]|uniref:hypothetical protein n=1 Tax=Streptomyces sp. CS-7 TaxID=2906769 RepID=UPI0021B422A2|nr:hypothetical protein [Streptomyces sp. CS-7]MCT6781933.1 hypothetical protein [Streptomyces sp. CS-7]